MVDDEHDDGVQSAAGVVMDAPPEWFKVDGIVAVRGGGIQRRGHPRCGEDVGVDRLPAAAAPPL